MEGNATTALNNCSDKIVNSHPVEMFEETSGYIIIIYIYAVLVVAATLFLYARYALSTTYSYKLSSALHNNHNPTDTT